MNIPEGWQLVPKEPTMEMLTAYERAMKDYIGALPAAARNKRHFAPKGYLVPQAIKVKIRWRAMLKAAPRTKPEPGSFAHMFPDEEAAQIPNGTRGGAT